MKYRGLIIADIHIGAIDDDILKKELYETFIKQLQDDIDFLIIDGDYFDSKMYLNNSSTRLAITLMNDIVTIAKRNDIKVRIVYGTESHDSNQYQIFNQYLNEIDIDFKVIYNVCEEELFPNMTVLYVPEEFIHDKHEYYKDTLYSGKKYNYIFGHGVIQEVMTSAVRNTHKPEKEKRIKVPVFTSAELDAACSGEVYFGHYHIRSNINDKIFYVGSYSRWRYGEEEDKGIFITEYDRDNHEYKHKFIINTLAKTYKTISYGYDNKIFTSQNEFIREMDSINFMVDSKKYDNVRVMLNIPEAQENAEFMIGYVKNKFSNKDNIKTDITNGFIDKKREVDKEEITKIVNEYDFVFSKMPIEDKVHQFIKIKNERDIPIDNIKKYLYDKIT